MIDSNTPKSGWVYLLPSKSRAVIDKPLMNGGYSLMYLDESGARVREGLTKMGLSCTEDFLLVHCVLLAGEIA